MRSSTRLLFLAILAILTSPRGEAQLLSDSTLRVRGQTAFAGDSLLKSPWGAVGRSFLIPGWGQLYNGSPKKSVLFIVTDVSMMGLYMYKDRKVQKIERTRKRIDRQLSDDNPFLTPTQAGILTARFNDLTADLDGALNDRNLYGWFFALSHLLGMVDAYVDAHLFGFDSKMELAGYPLPDGVGLSCRLTF